MAEPTTDLRSQRYLGDTVNKVVHDLMHEDPTPGGCGVWEVVQTGRGVRFTPDSRAQANAEGYRLCDKCFWWSDRRRTSHIAKIAEALDARESKHTSVTETNDTP